MYSQACGLCKKSAKSMTTTRFDIFHLIHHVLGSLHMVGGLGIGKPHRLDLTHCIKKPVPSYIQPSLFLSISTPGPCCSSSSSYSICWSNLYIQTGYILRHLLQLLLLLSFSLDTVCFIFQPLLLQAINIATKVIGTETVRPAILQHCCLGPFVLRIERPTISQSEKTFLSWSKPIELTSVSDCPRICPFAGILLSVEYSSMSFSMNGAAGCGSQFR